MRAARGEGVSTGRRGGEPGERGRGSVRATLGSGCGGAREQRGGVEHAGKEEGERRGKERGEEKKEKKRERKWEKEKKRKGGERKGKKERGRDLR